MQAEWDRCNGSLEKQKAVVEKNREAWEKLGFEVNDTNAYEDVAVKNSEAVVNALVARAKAAAYASLAETKYAEAIQLRLAAENVGTKWWQKMVVAMAGAGDEYGNGGISPEMQDEMLASFAEGNRQKMLDKAEKLEQEAEDLIKNGISQNDIASDLLKGLPTTVKNTTCATGKTYEDALAEILKQTDNFRKQLTDAQREGIRDAFDAEMDIAKGAEDWETYYKAQRDLAKFNYEQQKADALAAYEETEKEVAAKRAEWQKKGWDTSALDDQLQAAADLYKQKSENIEATYTTTLHKMRMTRRRPTTGWPRRSARRWRSARRTASNTSSSTAPSRRSSPPPSRTSTPVSRPPRMSSRRSCSAPRRMTPSWSCTASTASSTSSSSPT